MPKIQGSDGRIEKYKIAILNIDFILNYFASPKWVYMLKSVEKFEKWLCKARKYKTMADGTILNYSFILKFIRVRRPS
jgi:hypothetical protein